MPKGASVMKRLLFGVGTVLLCGTTAFAQTGGCGGFIEQSTAYEAKVGPFVSTANSALTTLVIGQSVSLLAKNGGDWTAKNESTSATHESAGWYRIPLDTTDTNTVGTLMLKVDSTGGSLPVFCQW